MNKICFILLISLSRSLLGREIVLYTSVDEPVVRPIIEAFEKKTGIEVRIVTDTEATKSIGLAERLRAEKEKPRCDVWWGNEPFHTANLASEGMFEAYDSPVAADVNDLYKDKQHRWSSCGLRARVIAQAMISSFMPTSIDDLTRPVYKNKVVMGKPAIGTIGGHVAAIYATRGKEKADELFKKLHDNGITLVGGNSIVVQQVAAGNFFAGLTDNDDVAANDTHRVSAVIPDQKGQSPGTLAIPTTVALIKRRDIQDDSKKLVDCLLSTETEKTLIETKYSGWSVRAKETEFRAMKIDYADVARSMPEAVRRASDILEGRDPKD